MVCLNKLGRLGKPRLGSLLTLVPTCFMAHESCQEPPCPGMTGRELSRGELAGRWSVDQASCLQSDTELQVMPRKRTSEWLSLSHCVKLRFQPHDHCQGSTLRKLWRLAGFERSAMQLCGGQVTTIFTTKEADHHVRNSTPELCGFCDHIRNSFSSDHFNHI